LTWFQIARILRLKFTQIGPKIPKIPYHCYLLCYVLIDTIDDNIIQVQYQLYLGNIWFYPEFADFWLFIKLTLTFVALNAHNSASTTFSALHHAVSDAQEYVDNEYA